MSNTYTTQLCEAFKVVRQHYNIAVTSFDKPIQQMMSSDSAKQIDAISLSLGIARLFKLAGVTVNDANAEQTLLDLAKRINAGEISPPSAPSAKVRALSEAPSSPFIAEPMPPKAATTVSEEHQFYRAVAKAVSIIRDTKEVARPALISEEDFGKIRKGELTLSGEQGEQEKRILRHLAVALGDPAEIDPLLAIIRKAETLSGTSLWQNKTSPLAETRAKGKAAYPHRDIRN